jgi:hypothetical protein
MSLVEPRRWTFTLATPGGDVTCTYDLTPDALEFDSDSLWDGGHVSVRWSAIVEAGTAALDMPVGRGAPDLGRFVPAKLEWLIASRSDANTKPFMHPLPPAPHRDALIASLRDRLGERWAGESIPLADARNRFRLPSGGENLKVAGIVVGVLALLVLLLILLMLLLSPVFLFPAGFALGVWLFRGGLSGLRDAISVANTPTARVSSPAIGLVEIEGLAKTAHPSPAAVTGRPSVWWDVGVDAWSSDRDRGGWRQMAARHGGTMDTLEVEDQTGRVLVWLKDAHLLLTGDSWETGKDRLPSPGEALLETLGFPWRANTRLRVRETRLEVDAAVYVLGTLDERRSIPDRGEAGMPARIASLIRTGQWRDKLLRMLPRWLAMLVATLFGFLSIVLGVGRGGERVKGPHDSVPPDMAPDAVLVWKGRAGRPFIVSNGREAHALSDLRTRSLYRSAAGIGVLCYCVYELFQLF